MHVDRLRSGNWPPRLPSRIASIEALQHTGQRPSRAAKWRARRRTSILICSCEDTMPLDADAVRRGCRGAQVTTARHLCRAEIDRFRAIAAAGAPLIVGCTQEAPLFSEVRRSGSTSAPITFVNIRETAGWSRRRRRRRTEDGGADRRRRRAGAGRSAGRLASDGVTLIYGRDERAVEAARTARRSPRRHGADQPPGADLRRRASPIFRSSRARSAPAKGHLGAFELTVDDFAQPAPSSRGALAFGPSRNGAVSRCDIILDLSGGTPLFPAHDLRDGYLRADPDDPRQCSKRC